MPYPFVGEIDMSKVHFGPMINDGTKQKVEIHKDGSSTKPKNKLIFNLCTDPREPLECRYKLDTVREDQDGSRRGLVVKIQDPECLKALQALDDAVIAHALKNCKELFKKNLSEDEIRLRYKPLVFKAKDEDEEFSVKFKVKCKGYPTELHLLHDDNTIEEKAGTLEHLSENGAYACPILSAYGLWFMGGNSFGITIQAEKMVVKPGAPRATLSEFCSKTPLEATQKRARDDASDPEDDGVKHQKAVEGEDDAAM